VIKFFLDLALTFDECIHRIIIHRLGKLGIDLLELFEKVNGRLNRFFDCLFNRLTLVELGFLFEIPDRVPLRENNLTVKVLIGTRDDPQQTRFTRAIEAQHTDLCPVKK
jgi:hypothetical protein